MNNYYHIWASFFILCCHLSTGSAYGPNVCTRLNHRPYIENVPKNSFSSYIRQNQHKNVQKGGYIWETQYFCCAGYEGSIDDCRPICEAGCGSHSSCVAPGECQCNKGYSWNKNSCQAICTQACPEHSSCLQPEQCVCDEGYVQKNPDSTNNTICKPNCSRGCGNGTCIEPEVCQCSAGLILVEDECVVDMRLTTDVVATSAMPAELLQLPISSCTDNCSCWQELSDSHIDDFAIKCVNICMDDEDQPCLELNRCHCDNQSSLICAIEKLQQRFICKIFNQLSPEINDNQGAPEVAALNSSENATSSDDWQAILIPSCIGLVFIALLVVLVRACIKGNQCTRIAVTSTLIILKFVAIAIRNANSKRTIDNPVFQPEINPYFNKQYKFH